MRPIYGAAALAAIFVVGLAATPALGDRAEGRMVHRAHSWMSEGGRGMGWHGPFFGRHAEGWIAFLKAELAITEEQEPQWNAFAEALRDGAARFQQLREERRAARDEGPISAVDRLERWQRFAETGAETIQSVRTAFDPLYATMTDDQKRQADRLLSRRRH